jgi:Tfp pilus assembly protein PilX
MRVIAILACMLFYTNAVAECSTTATGRTVCNNGQQAGGYNPNTGNAWKSERNQNGVATTTTNRGGEAKTRNGKGVYKSPSGKTCVRTATNAGCN